MAKEHPKERFAAFEILKAVDPDNLETRMLRVEDDGNDFHGLRVAMYAWSGTQWGRFTGESPPTVFRSHRVEFDANNNPLYQGFHETFQADPADPNWELEKFSGWGTTDLLHEGPETGRWDQKETYF